MVQQARGFNKAVGITGIVLTKLDGTSKVCRYLAPTALALAWRAHAHVRASFVYGPRTVRLGVACARHASIMSMHLVVASKRAALCVLPLCDASQDTHHFPFLSWIWCRLNPRCRLSHV